MGDDEAPARSEYGPDDEIDNEDGAVEELGPSRRLALESSKSVHKVLDRVKERKRARKEKLLEAQKPPEEEDKDQLEIDDAGGTQEIDVVVDALNPDEYEWVDVEEPDLDENFPKATEREKVAIADQADLSFSTGPDYRSGLPDYDEGELASDVHANSSEKERNVSESAEADDELEGEEKLVINLPDGEKPEAEGQSEAPKLAKRPRVSPEERAFFRALHEAHLTALIAVLPLRADDVAGDIEMQKMAETLLPDFPITKTESLRRAVVSFSASVHVAESYGVDRPESTDLHARVKKTLTMKVGGALEASVALASALRRRNLRVRIVSALNPLSHRPRKESIGEQKRIRSWCEVYISRRWVPACPETGTVDNVRALLREQSTSLNFRSRSRKGSRARSANKDEVLVAHAVSCENGKLRDVTRRYCRQWHRVLAERAPDHIFSNTLDALSRASASAEPEDSASEADREEFERLSVNEPLPTSQAAYLKHPRFALEKHLSKFEVVFPRKPVLGFCAGLPVFPRRCVQTLRSKERWVREMRVVKDTAESVRSIDARKGSTKEGEQIDLYGYWQTDPYQVPVAVDGIVPKDRSNKVEVWTPAHVPGGCVHVNMKYAAQMARRLQIDYAVAMTGFEVKQGGKCVPKFEGVVVCAENEELLEDAARAGMGMRIEAEAKKEFDEIVKQWRKLIRSARAKEKVRRKYGGSLEFDYTYLQAKKMGLDQQIIEPDKPATVSAGMSSHVHDFLDPPPVDAGEAQNLRVCKTCGATDKKA